MNNMTIKDFEALQKGDLIIVKWDKYAIKHMVKNEIEAYNIHEVKLRLQEIICRLKGNIYFNYSMFTHKTSHAIEVYKVESEG